MENTFPSQIFRRILQGPVIREASIRPNFVHHPSVSGRSFPAVFPKPLPEIDFIFSLSLFFISSSYAANAFCTIGSLRLKHSICFSFSQHLNTWSARHMNSGTFALSALDWSFISALPRWGRLLFLIQIWKYIYTREEVVRRL